MADRVLGSSLWTRQNGQNEARETRILRERLEAHAAALDQLAGSDRPEGSSRQLVRVYDGGSMGSGAPQIYLTHPVQATGAESEGTTPTLSDDTGTTIPVIFLKVPAAGEYATAYAAGGRWITERSSSSTCRSTVTVLGCGAILDTIDTLTINVYTSMGGTLLATATTTTGTATMSWSGPSGNYYWTVTGQNARFASFGRTIFSTCGDPVELQLLPTSSYACCTECFVPLSVNLTLSNACGSAVFTSAGGGDGHWVGPFSLIFNNPPCFGTLGSSLGIASNLDFNVGPTHATGVTCPPSFGASWAYTIGGMTATE
jgi:hypothetical protein